MNRTNIYLEENQHKALRAAAQQRGVSMAELVRVAVDTWLEAEGVAVVSEDEWQRRFGSLLDRRLELATALGFTEKVIGTDVSMAVEEVRRLRAARPA